MTPRLTPAQKRAQAKRDAWNEAQRPLLKPHRSVDEVKASAERTMHAHDIKLAKKLGLPET